MNQIAETILPYILLYKYAALFIVTFVASLAVPIPAGLLLVASSAFASQGYFNIVWVIATVIAANVLGDTLCYFLARYYGRAVLCRIGFRRILDSRVFKEIESRFGRRPGLIIVASRFETFATLSVNLLSGLSGVPYLRFALYEGIGAFIDAFAYGMVGYIFGDSWQAVDTLLGRFFLVAIVLAVIGVIAFGKKKKKAA